MQNKYGYLVWIIAALFVVYSFCLNTASAVFSDAIKISLHATNFQVSIASGAFILGFACMQIPVGYLLDKFNARFVVSSGVFLLAVGNGVISFSESLTAYTFANFLQGIGASFAFVSVAVLIAQWFSAKQFPLLFGLTQSVSCIASAIIHYYFTQALISHSWNDLYRGLAVFGLILLVFTLIFVKTPTNYKRVPAVSLRKSLSLVLKNKQILLCSAAAATSFGVLLAYAGLWYMKVQTYYSIENLQAVIIGGMTFLGIGIGTPLFAWLSNRYKSRVLVIHVTLCLGCMTLLLGIYLPHFAMSTLIIAHVTAFLIGFFLSGSMLFYTIVSEVSTDATRGVAISVLNTAIFLFNAIMLFLPYMFLTVTSTDFFTCLWILPFFVMLSVLMLYFIKDSTSS